MMARRIWCGSTRRGSRHRSEGREGTSRHRSPMPSPPSPGSHHKSGKCLMIFDDINKKVSKANNKKGKVSKAYNTKVTKADLVPYSGKRYIGKDLGVSEPGKAPPQDASDRWIFSRYTVQKGWYHYVPEDRLHEELKSETLNKPHEHLNLKVQQSALPPLVPPLNCLTKVWTEIEMWQAGFKIETHAAKFETCWVPMRSVFFVDFCNGPNFIRAEKKMMKNNLSSKTETNLCRVASSFFLVQHYSSPSEDFAWKHNGGN